MAAAFLPTFTARRGGHRDIDSRIGLYNVKMHVEANLDIVKSDSAMTAQFRKPAPRKAPKGGAKVPHRPHSYHHGDLRAALMAAAERQVAQNGLEGFSLRECAKMAGVSAAAPAHHFGNAAGLLQAVALAGFTDLSARMEAAAAALPKGSAVQRLSAMALAYIGFATEREGCFRVTFGGRFVPSETGNSGLIAASEKTFGLLMVEAARLPTTGGAADSVLTRSLLIWAFVHGMANLAIDRRLSFLAQEPNALMRTVLADFETLLSGR